MAEDEIECLERLLRNPWLMADMVNKCSLVRLKVSRKPVRILAEIPVDAQLVKKVEGGDYSVEDERAFCDESRSRRQTIRKLQGIMTNYNLVEYAGEKRQNERAVTLAYGRK